VSAAGVIGRITTRRNRWWASPSLHSVLPRRIWFMSSFIMTPNDDGNASQSLSAFTTTS
jgi:hypothetical protein